MKKSFIDDASENWNSVFEDNWALLKITQRAGEPSAAGHGLYGIASEDMQKRGRCSFGIRKENLQKGNFLFDTKIWKYNFDFVLVFKEQKKMLNILKCSKSISMRMN